MGRIITGSDFHLGARNLWKHRGFSSPEEHNEVIFDNLATYVTKRDSLILTGDVCQSIYWLKKLSELNVTKLTLVPGNHDVEKAIKMTDLTRFYDSIQPYLSRRNCWWTHIPIHPDHFRGRKYNIHGHLHCEENPFVGDPRYINVAIDHWDFKPICFAELIATHESRNRL